MIILFLLLLLCSSYAPLSAGTPARNEPAPAAAPATVSTDTIRREILSQRPVRGIHISAWGAGAPRIRKELIAKIGRTVINAVVIAVKEVDGKVYIPGVEMAQKNGAYEPAISRPEEMLKDFKAAGLHTAARIVVFKDNVMPLKRRDLAVHDPSGAPWRSRNGATWLDPYNRNAWAYALDIAERAAQAGFEEIQFDYLRYPTEGRTELCRYAKPHSRQTATENLGEFLIYARSRLKPYNVKISADVFGLTTTSKDDMGIGQDLRVIAKYADYVYPMMYPSHYYTGEYNIANPNGHPFEIINYGLRDALKRLGPDYVKLRPYLQDFNLGKPHYGPYEVRAQIIAAKHNLLESWVLWNAGNKYNWDALSPQAYRAFVSPDFPEESKAAD